MTDRSTKRAAVIGGGPAGLMAAEVLAAGGAAVTVYDRMPSAGRKFLMAGRGGLNLTHSEPLEAFMMRYGGAPAVLRAAIEAFPPSKLRDWSATLGQATFVGSSVLVFPQAFKASPLLRAWLRRLSEQNVAFRFRHLWRGFSDDGALEFDTPQGRVIDRADATVLALGGASWPRLGSDGLWTDVLAARGVGIARLQPANCGFLVNWSEPFRTRFAGTPLKRIALKFGGESVRGEAIVTAQGIEGGAVYALSRHLREMIAANGEAVIEIALRPDLAEAKLAERLGAPRGKQSLSTFLRKTLNLSPADIGLLHEAAVASGGKLAAYTPQQTAALINAVPVKLSGIAPLARAISTAGGITFDALDPLFMLKALPGLFAAGEMLDWDAPTGGYLLQASFATGAAAGAGALAWLAR